ncbi:MAG: helix-turn-helix transcriptional regulator [Phascolarctobacterium sp.]|nr:helix-turn-helix transcriptional regulator [Phascolarctobacterium sp.]MBQ5672770.1 helix-turn-helix transcriptional regulator [Phascolarctobacterium sp.]
MNERILELRKHLGLNQVQFGAKIQLKGNSISDLEKGKNAISERVIADICRVFNVSRLWLEEGKGPMFAPVSGTDTELMQRISGLIKTDDEFRKNLILEYLRLDEAQAKAVEEFLFNVVLKIKK